MRSTKNTMLALALGHAMLPLVDPPASGPERMIEPPTPRKFTDARIAEAEAKRKRKRAKRAAQFHKKGK